MSEKTAKSWVSLEEAVQLVRDRARWRSGVTRLLERADLSVS